MNFETAHSQPGKRPIPVQPIDDSDTDGERPPRIHPDEPDRPNRGSLSLLWILLVLAAAGLIVFGIVRLVQARAAASVKPVTARPVPVVAEAAKRQDMRVYLNGLGTVTPLNTVAVHTRVDGQLVKVAYTEGEVVHNDPTYDDQTMLDLDKGDKDKSDLLVEVDPRPYQVQLDTAKGQLARDQAQLANAKLDLERYQGLYSGKLSTDQQVKTQQALVAQLQGTIDIDQAAIHSAQLNLIYCHVRTPITGRVGLRLVDVGNIVHATDTNPVAVIAQLDPITVEFTLPEDDIPKVLAKGDGIGLSVEAWDRDFKTQIAIGSLTAIDNQVDPGTGTIRLRATFANPQNKLFANQFVNARLLVDTLKNVVVIPGGAVQRSPNSAFVYVVKADNTIEMRPVKPGITESERTVIEQGVMPDEKVVTDGIDKIQAGSSVSVKPPRATAESSDSAPTTQPGGRGHGKHSADSAPDAATGTPAAPSPQTAPSTQPTGETAVPATAPTSEPDGAQPAPHKRHHQAE